MSEIMKIIDKIETQKNDHNSKNKLRQKRTRGDRSYSERVRSK